MLKKVNKNKLLVQECIYKNTSQPGQGFTAIAAISQTMGVVHYLVTDSSVNQDTYALFITKLVYKLKTYETSRPFCIVQDNVAFHKCSLILEKFRSTFVQCRNTPPNSPF